MTNVADKLIIRNIYLRHPLNVLSCHIHVGLVPCALFTVTSCEISTLIWRESCTDTAEPVESILVCSEAWSYAAATTGDCLVLSDGAHQTRNSYKLRCLVLLMGVSHSCCNFSTCALSLVGPKHTWLMCSDYLCKYKPLHFQILKYDIFFWNTLI
jgi:hypothetical protein